MKKIWIIIICVLVLIGGASAYIIYGVLNSPEYAAKTIYKDVSEGGYEALLPHLTEPTAKKLQKIIDIYENPIVGAILAKTSADSAASTLLEKATEVKWDIGEVLKDGKRALITVEFDYNSKITGSVELELIRTDGEWKINNIVNPKFDF